MAHFVNCTPKLTCKYVNKAIHGGNHAPSALDWFNDDDTLDRQGVGPSRLKGHGICKGIASSWVIAFLKGTIETTDPAQYEAYFTNFLRFQATMIKDFGGHIDTHIAKLTDLQLDPNITFVKKLDIVDFSESDIPVGKWGAYISVWGHDIAIGGKWGAGSMLYINEPNTGLLGYKKKADFFTDLNAYMAARRAKKHKPLNEPAGFWIYKS
ncbi:MAG: hypothetical protein QM500_13290 [Methylococcales bacterium]